MDNDFGFYKKQLAISEGSALSGPDYSELSSPEILQKY